MLYAELRLAGETSTRYVACTRFERHTNAEGHLTSLELFLEDGTTSERYARYRGANGVDHALMSLVSYVIRDINGTVVQAEWQEEE